MSEFLKQLPRPEVHPLLPWLTEAELLALLDRPQGMDLFRAAFAKYTDRARAATDDPLYCGVPLDCWQIADEQLADPDVDIQVNFGWNRGGGKTHRGLARLCEAARLYPTGDKGTYLVLGETEDSSRNVQQPAVWSFLRPYIGALNGKELDGRALTVNEAKPREEGRSGGHSSGGRREYSRRY
jgi:hypothetical protein